MLTKEEEVLMDAADRGNTATILRLIRQNRVNVNCVKDTTTTPLLEACFSGNDEIVRMRVGIGTLTMMVALLYPWPVNADTCLLSNCWSIATMVFWRFREMSSLSLFQSCIIAATLSASYWIAARTLVLWTSSPMGLPHSCVLVTRSK